MSVASSALQILLMVFIVLLFGRVAVSLITLFSRDWKPSGVALILVEVVLSATDPPVHFLRHVLPGINLGGARLDLSVLVLMVVASLAMSLLPAVR